MCPASGSCASILSSDYATLFGLPLSLYGALVYGATLTAALLAGRAAPEAASASPSRAIAQSAMAGASAALVTTSAYLMAIVATQFDGGLVSCAYCLTSAGLSMSIAGLSLPRLVAREMPAVGSALALCVATLALGSSGAPSATAATLPFESPLVTTKSPPGAQKLARGLKESGAAMYGAFWCPHCQEQKELFGAEAMADFPYVECFPQGWSRGTKQAKQCTDAKVEGYPTWVLKDGTKLEGGRELAELEDILRGNIPPN